MAKSDSHQLRISESVNEFFARVLKMKESGVFKDFLRFLERSPDKISFNSALVFIQKPECNYYFTAKQWEERFHRTVKDVARPLVVLFPFGPVEFVYDYNDTEGEPITEEKILHWWRENGGQLDAKIMNNTINNLQTIGIFLKQMDAREYFQNARLLTAGYVKRDEINNRDTIILHPRYEKADLEAYGVLCHEIAHVLLGHLGIKTVSKWRKGGMIEKVITKDRQHLPRNIREVEAELVAWMVFNSLGIAKHSEEYVAMWMEEEYLERLEMSEVLKAVKKIQDMGRGGNVF